MEQDIPSIKLIQEQIEDTKRAITENIQNSIEALSIKKQNLKGQIYTTEEELKKLPITERQYIDIQRNFLVNNNIYTYLLEKRAEAGIAMASNIADNKILDWARIENTQLIKPRKSMNYMMAILIGILIPFILIFIVEYFNNRILSRSDIERQTKVPILGAIGHNSFQTDLPVYENPKSSLAETLRALRTNLKFLATDTQNQIISISSSLTGEGKTFCALNLATIFAMSDKKTLLVGLDLRKPKIHKVFNIDNSMGISTFLSGQSTFEDIYIQSTIPNLFITPSGPIPPNPAELIDSKTMDEFFANARKNFDFIILDTPPIAIVTDALLIAKRSDINIFVIRQNFTSKGILPLIEEIYQKEEMKNLSIIINDLKIGGYYSYTYDYGYGYGYAYNYGYRYAEGYYSDEGEEVKLGHRLRNLFKRTI
jgi:capsular exopolysaccharide synthesis family protein